MATSAKSLKGSKAAARGGRGDSRPKSVLRAAKKSASRKKARGSAATVRDLYLKGVRRFHLPGLRYDWYQILSDRVVAFSLSSRASTSIGWALGHGAGDLGGKIAASSDSFSLTDFLAREARAAHPALPGAPSVIPMAAQFLGRCEILAPVVMPNGRQIDFWIHVRFGSVYADAGPDYAAAVNFLKTMGVASPSGEGPEQFLTNSGRVNLTHFINVRPSDVMDLPVLATRELK